MPTVSASGSLFKTCKNQTYALCAAAQCKVYNGVAYCQCEIKSGDSISLTLDLNNGEDVCSVNASGVNNGYMVSTYSLPESVLTPNGNLAIYTCPGEKSDGAYAQCDGGLCSSSSEGATYPGFATPGPQGQITCSCPITTASPGPHNPGYQILGPYPCQKSFFQYCKKSTANTSTGATIYVGAPTGTARALTYQLNGSVPTLNECR
jgi:hypothetical protein